MNIIYSIYVLIIALVKTNVGEGWITLSLQQSGMFFLKHAMFVLAVAQPDIENVGENQMGLEPTDMLRTSSVFFSPK